MQPNNPACLRSSIIAAGKIVAENKIAAARNLQSRILAGLDTKATWDELAHGSILQGQSGELQGQSIVVATIDQFRATAALIELDGVARRIVLYPPDLPLEHLPYVVKTAEADAVVTDQLQIEFMLHGSTRVVLCGKNIAPCNVGTGAQVETEWILLTSGTTGNPKLAMHTLASLAGSARQTDPTSASTVWSTFYDMRRYGGLHIFLHAALSGSSLVVSSAQESTADFLSRAGANGVTHISGTPSHWRRALMSPFADRIDPQYIRMSGEIVDQAILNQVKAQYPQARVAHTFASTEAGAGFNVNDGLMGFPPEILTSNPLIEMKVKDGTLRIRSTRTAFRYLAADNPVLKDAEGFVDTGDTLELRDGRYYFTGRRDGTINVGGYKVHPEEVEAVINRHPAVVMSLVKAKKSPITGELVVADVVPKTPLEPISSPAITQEILQFCRAELDPRKVPTAINIVPMLTIGQSGKLVRRDA
ncbi:MAG TPA: long-chain fatty acid--CoA ligase [Terracidiphilus sp.]|jgi:acyl-coenzyme A synthetase/AMP-(fatty) acid ligase